MFIPRLYYPHPMSSGSEYVLDKAVTHYLAQVIRLRINSPIILFNDTGGEFHGTIQEIGKTITVKLASFEAIDRTSPLKIHLGQGLARSDRMDTICQKATELGVHTITPLITQKSLIKLDHDRELKKRQHWEKIVISAAEQSGLNRLPQLEPVISLANWCRQPFDGISILLDPNASQTLNMFECPPSHQVRLAIGAESGWTESERDLLISQHFTPCRLGPRVLRTETAGLVAISVLQSLWGDLID